MALESRFFPFHPVAFDLRQHTLRDRCAVLELRTFYSTCRYGLYVRYLYMHRRLFTAASSSPNDKSRCRSTTTIRVFSRRYRPDALIHHGAASYTSPASDASRPKSVSNLDLIFMTLKASLLGIDRCVAIVHVENPIVGAFRSWGSQRFHDCKIPSEVCARTCKLRFMVHQ